MQLLLLVDITVILNGDDDALDGVDDVPVRGLECEFARGEVPGRGGVDRHRRGIDAVALEVGADALAVGPEGEGVGFVVGVEEGFAVCAVGGVGVRDGGLEGEP